MEEDRLRPVPPIKNELGGDYYYKCGYIMCNADIKRTDNYCALCGTKIDWENIDANKQNRNVKAVYKRRKIQKVNR